MKLKFTLNAYCDRITGRVYYKIGYSGFNQEGRFLPTVLRKDLITLGCIDHFMRYIMRVINK